MSLCFTPSGEENAETSSHIRDRSGAASCSARAVVILPVALPSGACGERGRASNRFAMDQ